MTRERLTEEPPDPVWVQEEADRRRDLWEAQRGQRRVARNARRESEPLHKRVHALEVQLALAAVVPAGAIASSGGGGGPESKVPPHMQVAYSGESPGELARLMRLLADVVRRLERLADSDPQEPLLAEDIDLVLVRDYEGYSAEDAAALEPLFGSAEAVRRARRRKDRRGEDGKTR